MKFDLDEMYRMTVMTVILIICMLSFIVVKSCIHEMNYIELQKVQFKHEQLLKGIKE